MINQWKDGVTPLHGRFTTLREVEVADVHTLFMLFSDPAVTAHMAPPPPTPAKFAGFVEWAHRQRKQCRGACFGIVPHGMASAVGILQVRHDPQLPGVEWGFVVSKHFWSTGLFGDAAATLLELLFTSMQVERLEARVATRNQRGNAALKKMGARLESTRESVSPVNIPRDPESVWGLWEADWRSRTPDPRLTAPDGAQRVRAAVEAAELELRRREAPETVEDYPLFLFDRRRRE